MKKIFRVLALCFSVLLLLCSCGKENNADQSENLNNNEVVDTVYNFVTNGNSDYIIVIPENATKNEIYASEELSYFLNLATGISFKVVNDTVTAQRKYLSVGNTSFFRDSGIDNVRKEELKSSGYVVKTVGENVFMTGAEDLGTIYSVYKFLEGQIGYKYYSYDCIKYDEIKSVKLKKFNVTDMPSFEYRETATRNIWDHNDRSTRLKFQKPFVDAVSGLRHNAQYIIPYDIYAAQHPEWFAATDTLCYLAGEELENEVTEYFKKVLTINPSEAGKDQLFFGISDSEAYCTCSKCSAAVAKYGSITSTMIIFLNHVSDKLKPWIEENQPGRDVTLMFLAYKSTLNPPVTFNEKSGEYEFSQDIVMRDNVGVLVAPIMRDFNNPLETLEEEKRCFEGWSKITKHLSYYEYFINYAYPMYLFNNFETEATDYKYLKDLGVDYVFAQDIVYVDGWQTFSAYKTYLASNLMWNVNSNRRALTVDFFNNYYGAGAYYLLKYFDEWQNQYNVLVEKYGLEGTCFDKMNKPEYWPMTLLGKWIEYMDQAISAIDRYKYIDLELYDNLYRHILIEKTSLQYRMIDIYGADYYDSDNLIQVKKEVWANMSQFSMVTTETSSAYSNLLSLADIWGIKER